ncbi:MAG: DNA-binding response regulator [Spirochaetaceae bacterium]|nr:MAG: DNA-binding response regulator [Spirochaetaceae bacterium]
MRGKTVLVVDDEKDIAELVRVTLNREGFAAECAYSGEDALARAATLRPDLIVLDLMLPGVSGIEVCKRLKTNESTRGIPVLMLTAKTEDSDIVVGLESGADDYLTKPFSPKVLVARVKTILRRERPDADTATAETISIHGVTIDVSRHEVHVDGGAVQLSATEFAILEFLARNPGWVFSRYKIIDAVKGKDYPVTERSVDVQILGLRKKLGSRGSLIETVRGVGYRLRAR